MTPMHPDQHADLAAAHRMRAGLTTPDDPDGCHGCGHDLPNEAQAFTIHGESWCSRLCWLDSTTPY